MKMVVINLKSLDIRNVNILNWLSISVALPLSSQKKKKKRGGVLYFGEQKKDMTSLIHTSIQYRIQKRKKVATTSRGKLWPFSNT